MKTNERKYLEISTAHLKQKTLEGLNAIQNIERYHDMKVM